MRGWGQSQWPSPFCLCTAKPEPPLVSSMLLRPPESPVRWWALGVGGASELHPNSSPFFTPAGDGP